MAEMSPEKRAALGARMREVHAAKKAATATASVPLDLGSDPSVGEPEPPIPVPLPPPSPAATTHRRVRPSPPSVPPSAVPHPESDVPHLIAALSRLALDTMTYDECGQLINAAAAAITSLSDARRKKQEQLEAGTHKAPCSTCRRPIDISKSGSYQILTVRDEYFQPKNVYFCSQNCLLARNMPSHAKSTPRQKEANKA